MGTQGDSYVLRGDFTDAGARSRSILRDGASEKQSSPPFADQAPLFVRRRLKPTWRTIEQARAHLEQVYPPGE